MKYVFGDSRTDSQRLATLASKNDAATLEWIDYCIDSEWEAKRILIAGAGGFDLAISIANRVGPLGFVLVTDVVPLKRTANLPRWVNFQRFDISKSNTRIERDFDIAHARLLLGHMENSDGALSNLIRVLRPGGLIVLEDLDRATAKTIEDVPPFDECRNRVAHAVAQAGYRDIGSDLYKMLLRQPCTKDIQARGITRYESGGAGSDLNIHIHQYARLIEEGILLNEPTVESLEAAIQDGRLISRSSTMVQAAGIFTGQASP